MWCWSIPTACRFKLQPDGKRSRNLQIAVEFQRSAGRVAPFRMAKIDFDVVTDIAPKRKIYSKSGILHADIDIRSFEDQPHDSEFSAGRRRKVPPRPASFFAVNAADADWVDRQCTMHPLSSFEASARISGACDSISTIGYIRASRFDGPFGQFYAKAGERRWWQAELACGHDVMLDMPNELTALLVHRT